MTKRVTLDARWIVGGIGTYTWYLLAGLRGQENGFEMSVITHGKNAKLVAQRCANVTVLNAPIYNRAGTISHPAGCKGVGSSSRSSLQRSLAASGAIARFHPGP